MTSIILKERITPQLSTLSDKYLAKTISKMLNRISELEQMLYEEEAMARGEDCAFFKKEIDIECLPEDGPDNLKELVKEAFFLFEKIEATLKPN